MSGMRTRAQAITILDINYDSVGLEDTAPLFDDFEDHVSQNPIMDAFIRLGGLNVLLDIVKATVVKWKHVESRERWSSWIDKIKESSQVPQFNKVFLSN